VRVAIYARVSTADADDPNSIPVQLADCRERAGREGWEVVAEHVDEGVSAWDTRKSRPAYRRLMEDLREGRADAVLAREMERLLRQMKEGRDVITLHEEVGFHRLLFTLENDIDLRRARDRKEFYDRVNSAEFYSAFLGEKIRRTTGRKAAAGEWHGGGRRPFGFDVRGPRPYRLVHNPGEAARIRDAARRVLAGQSLHSVTREWNDGSHPVAKDSGGRWTVTDVRRVLLSEQVAGRRGDVEGSWRPILDWETHLALVELLSDPQRRPAVEYRQSRRWPLAGLVRCGRCGSRMDVRSQTRPLAGGGAATRRQYVCSSRNGGCSEVAITAPDLERHVVAWALDNVPEPEPEEARRPEQAAGETEVVRRLRELEERKRGLGGAYGEGLMTAAQVHEATVVLDAEIATARQQLAAAESPRPRTLWKDRVRRMDEWWDFMEGRSAELDPEEAEGLNEFLRWAVDRVTVGPARARGVRFDPSRVSIRPR
jgi:site-specific DNA recombinase